MMATQAPTQTPNERRERAKNEVLRLIEDRNTVLAQYYNLVKQIEELDTDSSTELLHEFCQQLVDYLAAGHFELYRRIEEGNERRNNIKKLSADIMPKITTTTQVAIAFNDLIDHAGEIDGEILEQLPDHLARLGEHLATRIDLEDQLINTLLASSVKPDLKSVTA